MTQASCEIVAGLFLVASFLLAHTRRNSWIYFLKGVLIYIGELPSSYLHQDVEVPYFYKYVPRFFNTIAVIKKSHLPTSRGMSTSSSNAISAILCLLIIGSVHCG
jgi:hypothetical protein